MIAIDSASYPCLAVIQHFNVPEDKQGELYEYGQHLRDVALNRVPGGITLNLHKIPPWLTDIEHHQLLANYSRAARQFGWGS